MTPDAFRHVPALRQRIKHPDLSDLRVTPSVMAAWDARALALGRAADWRQSDQALEDSQQALLRGIDAA